MEIERLGHLGSAVIELDVLGLVIWRSEQPDGVHTAMVELDEIFCACYQARAHSVIIAAHFVMAILYFESMMADNEFRRAHKVRRAGNQLRKFTGDPEGHESAHRKAGGGAMVAFGNSAVARVNVGGQLLEVERELTIGLDRSDIPRARVLLIARAWIVAVQLDDDHIMIRYVGPDGIAPVIGSGVVIAILLTLHRLAISLAVGM